MADGFLFFCPLREAEDRALAAGTWLTAEELNVLGSAGEVLLAEEKALVYLASAEHCAAQLSVKLARRGFSADSIRQALDKLTASGELDEGRYAREWIRVRLLRHPEGPSALAAGLRHRGVSRSLAEEIVAREITEEVELDAAGRVLAKYMSKHSLTMEESIRLLKSRGFSWNCIRSALRT